MKSSIHPACGTIVLLTDEYVDYRKGLVDSVAERLVEYGYGTLCIAGQQLGIASVCNSIYSLANRLEIKGVICLSGTLGQRLKDDELREFLASFPVPMVSLGLQVEGFDSVMVNDATGMTKLMQHLLSHRDCRRLAFIRGFAGDPYSLHRENIFRTMLKQHGHVVDEELMIEGNFDAFDTYRAVSALLRLRPDVDTFVAANDIMALSAARAVMVAGFVIPEDIAITGFDDTQDATRNSPAISTVRQPFDELVRVSVSQLLDRIADSDQDVPTQSVKGVSHQWVDSEFIPRASTQSKVIRAVRLQLSDQASISAWLHSAMTGLPTPETLDLEKLCTALWETMDTGSLAVSECIEGMLERGSGYHNNHWWNNVCDRIETLTIALSAQESSAQASMRILFALAKARERIWALSVEREYQVRRQQGLRAAMQLRMSSCSDQAGLLETMSWWMQALEPARLFLVRYCNAGTQPDTRATLVHSYLGGLVSSSESAEFPISQLLPDEHLSELARRTFVLNPIYAGNQQFGYLLIDPTGIEHLDLNSAANSIGNAMRNHFNIGKLEYQTERLTAANQRLQKLAHFDSLTNLPNRGHFQSELDKLCMKNTPLALMFMDLDGFKFVNDSAGHDAGDQLLQQVAQRLRDSVAKMSDGQGRLARLGGDEFTLILIGHENIDRVIEMAEQLLLELARPYLIDSLTHQISVSIGCALFPGHADSSRQLIKNADVAMYYAKTHGKNSVACFPLPSAPPNITLLHSRAS
ncbi:GGDEF domain-containing protein [Granulosicoccus antarcticus]|uniref:Cyclic di-GMP phosphodiesterase Gmr n=1 Tax=Granulosicoccus antarcticus IMCC3135 TaxID=1192854 RepID=A0A2Z2NYM2_9GAMM|nr:GGDEF domain-containing protein [Granulosicoccus antarcticus]ASJ76546.1 Cyclic di-GMP phosphodiesterase Gmr [Granulosicoccus antarcticus IMCC3135]